jgi:hypothetical protein
MFKLGTMVTDSVTGLKGMLTHLQIEGDSKMYLFQPRGLNPKTEEPVDAIWIAPDRILNGQDVAEPYLALDALGTEVEDEASGFKGVAVAAVLHINGCIHLDIQPAGIVKETGRPIKRNNFDIRRLKGKAIKPMNEAEREKSQTARPSPAPFPRLR